MASSDLKERLRRYYERSASERGDMDDYQYIHTSPALLLEAIRNYGRALSGPAADLGCGDGRVCLQLADLGLKIFGLDISWKRCARAREKFADRGWGSRFLQADAGSLPFKGRTLSGLVITEVLEHVADADEVLAEIGRVLKPAGRVILSIPTVSWRKYILIKKNRFAVYSTDEHLREYSYFDLSGFDEKFIRLSRLEKTLGEHGFRIIKKQGIGYDFCKLLYFIPGLAKLDRFLYSAALNRFWSRVPVIKRLSVYRIYLLEKEP